MGSFWGNIGIFAVLFMIVCGYEKILEYLKLKRLGNHVGAHIYKARRLHGRAGALRSRSTQGHPDGVRPMKGR